MDDPVGRSVVKKIWDICPEETRTRFCGFLGALFANKRDSLQSPPQGEPYYICGAFRSLSGIGQGARLYAAALEKSGKKVFRIDVTRQMRMPSALEETEKLYQSREFDKPQSGGTVVIHANPPQFFLVLASLGKKFLQGKHITGFWAWEKESLPKYWLPAFDYADGFEAPSNFVRDILSRHTTKPVTLHPHDTTKPASQKKVFAKDGKLHCLFIFDLGSSFERKNPLAALTAFRKAFAPGEATLTFKIENAESFPEQYAIFAQACSQTPGVSLINRHLDSSELERLYLDNDIYISLHGSEGYGLSIKEALDYGLYAITTAYGGNMDFMKGEKALLVKPKSFRNGYAVPDVEEAAAKLHELGMTLLGK